MPFLQHSPQIKSHQGDTARQKTAETHGVGGAFIQPRGSRDNIAENVTTVHFNSQSRLQKQHRLHSMTLHFSYHLKTFPVLMRD